MTQNRRAVVIGAVLALLGLYWWTSSRMDPRLSLSEDVPAREPPTQHYDLLPEATLRLPSGIINVGHYRFIEQNGVFREMEQYNNDWLAKHGGTVRSMGFPWEVDAFHWFSRRYEYPFHWERINAHLKLLCRGRGSGDPPLKVLDMGSGISFFHYYVQAHAPCPIHVVASDYDRSYGPIFAAMNENEPDNTIEHKFADMREREEYQDESYDLIYCVSVIEHIPQIMHANAIQEVARILKTGGAFVVTFDISVAPQRAIDPQGAANLLGMMRMAFVETNPAPRDEIFDAPAHHHLTPINSRVGSKDMPGKNLAFTVTCHSFVKPRRVVNDLVKK